MLEKWLYRMNSITFAYAAVKDSTWDLVCGASIHSLIIGVLIAMRNSILVESLRREK